MAQHGHGGLRHDNDGDRFVVVPRPTIRDDRLSFRARGLLAFILDLPEGWEIRATWLATQGKEGEEAIYSALRELRAVGYYRVERRKGAGGRWVNGTAIRKRPSAQWAEEYAAEAEARAAKRKVEVPTYEPDPDALFDLAPPDQESVTECEAPDTFTGSAVSPSRSGSAVSGSREAGNGKPPSPTEEQPRRSENGSGNSGGEPHVSRAAPADATPAALAPTGPAAPAGGNPAATEGTPPPPPSTRPPERCPVHLTWTGPVPPCDPCRRAREAAEAWDATAGAAAATWRREEEARARTAARQARELDDAARRGCRNCDDDGFVSVAGDRLRCRHDGRPPVRGRAEWAATRTKLAARPRTG